LRRRRAISWETWTEDIIKPGQDDVTEVVDFLRSIGLGYDPHPDVIVVIRTASGAIAACGSLAGKVIKHLGVAPDLRESGLVTRVFDRLYRFASDVGHEKVFAFTTPASAQLLEGLGFRRVEGTSEAVLLEFVPPGVRGISEYLTQLGRLFDGRGRAGAIVMNANPFTLGHLHLATFAASECKRVCIFVVSEDRSVFPTSVRVKLIRAGTESLGNVTVIEGGDYIISQATFPLYFLRQPDRAVHVQASLDAAIFARRIAPACGIAARFVGEEPYDPTTQTYNQAMSEVFTPAGIALRIIPRLEQGGAAISASSVRHALKVGDWDTIARLVPRTTLSFLRSRKAGGIIHRIRTSDTPH
jgi:[citrate (pro-3S)-lyase] ligase